MTEISSFLKWFEELGKVGFAPLLGLVLFGSYFGVWVWGKFHITVIADLKANHAAEIAVWKERYGESVSREHELKQMVKSMMKIGESIADAPPPPPRL